MSLVIFFWDTQTIAWAPMQRNWKQIFLRRLYWLLCFIRSTRRKKTKLKGGDSYGTDALHSKGSCADSEMQRDQSIWFEGAGLLPFLKLGQLKCRREAVEEFLRKYEGYDVSDPNNIIPLEQGEEVKPWETGNGHFSISAVVCCVGRWYSSGRCWRSAA